MLIEAYIQYATGSVTIIPANNNLVLFLFNL